MHNPHQKKLSKYILLILNYFVCICTMFCVYVNMFMCMCLDINTSNIFVKYVDRSYQDSIWFVSDTDRYCRSCSAYKKVYLTDGLCQVCVNRRICSKCGHRRQDRFFDNDADFCTTCERKQTSPHLRASVQNTFGEEDLPTESNARDVGLLIRGLEDTIAARLQHELSENGYVNHFKILISVIYTT